MDRRLLWLAQTPQSFRYDLVMNAHTKAVADKVEGTDDSSLVERIGTKVVVAVGSYSNIKMTSPEDLPMFEYFLGQDVKARLDSAVNQGTRESARESSRDGTRGRPRHRRRRPRRPPAHKPEGGHTRAGEPRQRRPKEMKGAHHRDGVRHS
jgi:hypothetical protein